ncbi:MAG: histidine phosphatase family protein [Clostridia bacterium]|nr:histidine phosphatase family protein [Clostridia bacterium]
MPSVTFMRHAETVYNANKIFAGRINCELSAKGIQDTLKIPSFQKNDFDVYYCSPLKRSIDTLKLVVKGVEQFKVDDRIIEISVGDWEGKSKDSIPEELVRDYRNGTYTPPNAETTEEVDRRVTNFVTDLFEKYDKNTKILVVTHNGVMRSIKRNFVFNYENIMLSNLDCITLDENNYNYYLNNKIKNDAHEIIR